MVSERTLLMMRELHTALGELLYLRWWQVFRQWELHQAINRMFDAVDASMAADAANASFEAQFFEAAWHHDQP
jgi:hypothetical protein